MSPPVVAVRPCPRPPQLPQLEMVPDPNPQITKPRFMTVVRVGEYVPPPPPVLKRLGLTSLYSFSSMPAPLPSRPRKKRAAPYYPQDGSILMPGQLHDKRIVRGSTFAAHPQAQGDGCESMASRAARTRRRALARKMAAARLRPGSPPPAPGRRHHPIQTDQYLEELFCQGEEVTRAVQTDLFHDRPPTPLYKPAKTGADVATQIYPGELFDFDVEVQPVLETLVGKTAEQALAEVAQEEELAALREQQRRFRELRDAERAERERLAAQDLRLHAEKERRVAQARVARASAIAARERAAAAVLVQGYIKDLIPNVLAGLREAGYMLSRTERGAEREFVPWLAAEAARHVEESLTARDVLHDVIKDVAEARNELYKAAGDKLDNQDDGDESDTPPSTLYGEGEEEDEN